MFPVSYQATSFFTMCLKDKAFYSSSWQKETGLSWIRDLKAHLVYPCNVIRVLFLEIIQILWVPLSHSLNQNAPRHYIWSCTPTHLEPKR